MKAGLSEGEGGGVAAFHSSEKAVTNPLRSTDARMKYMENASFEKNVLEPALSSRKVEAVSSAHGRWKEQHSPLPVTPFAKEISAVLGTVDFSPSDFARNLLAHFETADKKN